MVCRYRYALVPLMALSLFACEDPVVTGTGGASQGAIYSYGAASTAHASAELGGDQQACHWDASCDEGFVCIGVCQPRQSTPGAFAGPCNTDGSCAAGLECRAGSVCVDPISLGNIYEGWAQDEDSFFAEPGLIGLDQRLDPDEEQDVMVGPIAQSARLENFLPPVGNQGGLGSCAAWAVGYGMRGYQAAKLRGFWSASTEHLLSPTFLFSQVSTTCRGSNTAKNVDMLADQGIPTMSVLPYVGLEAACRAEIDDVIREAAALNKSRPRITLFNKRTELTASLGVEDVLDDKDMRQIKYTLFSGQPVVVSIKTYTEFMRLGDQVLDTITEKNEGKHGYHAIVVVGYDDESEVMTIMNSWSPTWGDQGYGKIKYDIFKKITGAAFYSLPLPPPSDVPVQMPDPSPSDDCDGVSNLTCAPDKRSLIQTCDGETVETTECTEEEVCYLRAPNTRGPNVSGVAGCYDRQELLEHCGEDNVIEQCVPATSKSGTGSTRGICYDTPLFTDRCASGELCTTRDGSPACVDAMELEGECMGGFVSSCNISIDNPGVTSIETKCDGEVVRRVKCMTGTTCYARSGSEPECLSDEALEMACGMDEVEYGCLDAGMTGPMIVTSCGGKLLNVVERCNNPDFDGDDEHVCRRGLSPETRPTCEPATRYALEVVLGWDGGEDLDLFVEQPNGVTLSYQRLRDDDTQGSYDASEPCLPGSVSMCTPGETLQERVLWRMSAMPESGTYSIRIANGRKDVAVPAIITVYANDRVKFSRSITSPGVKGERSEPITFTF